MIKKFVFAVFCTFLPFQAYADCTNPARVEGQIVYNADFKVLQYCDGATWVAMHHIGTGSGGCTDPAKPEGQIIYNADYRVIQGCAGSVWRAMGPVQGNVTDGLVSHWKLDEASGTSAADSSGNGNTGTLQAGMDAANDTVAGPVGAALDFDGTDDYISVANELNFDFEQTDPFTLSAWIYRDTDTTEDDIIEKVTPGSYAGYALWFEDTGGGRLTFTIASEGSGYLRAETSGTVSTGSWHHVAATYDGSSTVNGMKIYIDGVSQTFNISWDSLSGGSILNDYNLLIGADLTTDTCCVFDGKIDDVRIYDRALTVAEVTDLYQAGPSAPVEAAKITPSVTGDNYEFGAGDVVLVGNLALVAAHREADPGTDSGAVYIFDVSDPGNPVELSRTLMPACCASTNNFFGGSVSAGGSVMAIGGPLANNGASNTGAAFLFDISDPANPVKTADLFPSDVVTEHRYGSSAAVDGTLALIGASGVDTGGIDRGAAYLFDISDPANPVQKAKIMAAVPANSDLFGTAVALSGNLALITARRWNNGADSNAGAAYLFDLSDPANPVEKVRFTASDAQANDEFGWAAELKGTLAIVTAPFEDGVMAYSSANRGAAYLFDVSDPANPVQKAKITPSDTTDGDSFGFAVALSGNLALIGANDETNIGPGSAYLFDISDPANPVELAKITASDGVDSNDFGRTVNLSATLALVGDKWVDGAGTNRGAAYVFSLPGTCADPVRPEGTLLYNSSSNVMQYCDGVGWVKVGK